MRAPRQFVPDLRRRHGRIVGAFLLAFTPVLLGGLAWLTALFVKRQRKSLE